MSLIAEVQLAENLHVYAPGVTGYKPIELQLDLPEEIKGTQLFIPHHGFCFFQQSMSAFRPSRGVSALCRT